MTGKRRRGHGEGTVFKRGDGLWVAAIDVGWIDGKRRRKTVYAATEKEVLAKRDELRRQFNRGVDLAATPQTVAEWLDEWMRVSKASDGTSGSTLARYESVIRVHLVPSLGTVKLSALTPHHVQALVSRLRQTAAASTVVKVHGVLRNALADAERMDLIPRNVVKSVRPASISRTERRALTPSEAKWLIEQLDGDRLEGVFIIALTTGLRRGEVLGLRWTDLDLDAGTLFVRQAIQRVDGQLRVVPPKTHRSARAVPLPRITIAALTRHRARQAAERVALGTHWQDNGLVFTSHLGTPMEPRNVNRRFDQARDAAGLSWVRLHDLRHAFATFLLDQGEELRTVMDLLGHSTIRLTADTYGHVLPSRARSASEAIDHVLG